METTTFNWLSIKIFWYIEYFEILSIFPFRTQTSQAGFSLRLLFNTVLERLAQEWTRSYFSKCDNSVLQVPWPTSHGGFPPWLNPMLPLEPKTSSRHGASWNLTEREQLTIGNQATTCLEWAITNRILSDHQGQRMAQTHQKSIFLRRGPSQIKQEQHHQPTAHGHPSVSLAYSYGYMGCPIQPDEGGTKSLSQSTSVQTWQASVRLRDRFERQWWERNYLLSGITSHPLYVEG